MLSLHYYLSIIQSGKGGSRGLETCPGQLGMGGAAGRVSSPPPPPCATTSFRVRIVKLHVLPGYSQFMAPLPYPSPAPGLKHGGSGALFQGPSPPPDAPCFGTLGPTDHSPPRIWVPSWALLSVWGRVTARQQAPRPGNPQREGVGGLNVQPLA